jgi:recombination protein RecR
MYPNSIKKLIESFKCLPGIGSKSAERLAFSMIDFDKDNLTAFSEAVIGVRDNIHKCVECGNISDEELCSICSSDVRNKKIVFVVEKAKDIILFEKLNVYNGVYHVLEGLISPIDGIGPDDISIESLLDKIDENGVEELIFALKPSIEGEATMQYISRILGDKNVKISKIATGIPMGTDMEYIDSLTLELAIDERKKVN